ncbi:anthranilate synthase component 1 [Scopulibacillus darangshiensis]|uniref:Anthranilate synthase component 1 n=1 Tax=Scopulibacillus darangshiensis TaxID=442528 RepID=A0A4R2P9C2_9BACL|nr:anthranilate synthase component I [Scopulibacillus darangshiensis]TCP31640.1 anthranilate synthase component 1 [Scopulibacillus darangshiensis]
MFNQRSSDGAYLTIPLRESFFTDRFTPIEIVECFKDRFAYLLESRDQGSWARYSFIGIDPFAFVKKGDEEFVLNDVNGEALARASHLRELFENAMAYLKVQPIDSPLPFTGGAVGCIAYDAISDFDKVPRHDNHDLCMPAYHFVFCKTIIAFDHYEQKITVIHFAMLHDARDEEQKEIELEKAKISIKNIVHMLQTNKPDSQVNPWPEASHSKDIDQIKWRSTMAKSEFVEKVKRIKQYIASGDVFQTVLSHRIEIDLPVTSWDLYRTLRVTNPSPYLFYLKCGDFEVVGSSPERIVKVQGNDIEIHPIAGTRPRGQNQKEDDQLAQDLLEDEKERAEHMMLVDLARNDAGKVSDFGSVKVPKLMAVERFSQVMHLVSIVSGTMRRDCHPVDAFTAAFPAGTLSGAPKIRAMEIIHELEPTARGFYGGAVGYFGFDGSVDTCITIRTFSCKGNKAYIQAGAGIVADSDPELEWEETFNKARALIKTVERAEKLFRRAGEVHHV